AFDVAGQFILKRNQPMKRFAALFVFAMVCVLAGMQANAQLLGTTVNGQMLVSGNPPNYFDSTNGFVPAGFGNSSMPGNPNVVIANPLVEFGYMDGFNTISANFTGNTLTLTDVSMGSTAPITYKFTDTVFAGLNVAETSDNFLSGGATGSLV